MAVMRSDDIPNVTQAETDLEVRSGERNRGVSQCQQFGEPLLKKREKWRTPSCFGRRSRQTRFIFPT
jgi:hypothetical protein